MKNLFAAILIALTVSTSSVSFAAATKTFDKGQTEQAAPASVTFAQIIKSKLDVVIQNAVNPNMRILLSDATGKTIAFKTLSKNKANTRIRFDLANLSDGLYYVRVSDGKNIQIKKFEIKTAVPAKASYQDVTFI